MRDKVRSESRKPKARRSRMLTHLSISPTPYGKYAKLSVLQAEESSDVADRHYNHHHHHHHHHEYLAPAFLSQVAGSSALS